MSANAVSVINPPAMMSVVVSLSLSTIEPFTASNPTVPVDVIDPTTMLPTVVCNVTPSSVLPPETTFVAVISPAAATSIKPSNVSTACSSIALVSSMRIAPGPLTDTSIDEIVVSSAASVPLPIVEPIPVIASITTVPLSAMMSASVSPPSITPPLDVAIVTASADELVVFRLPSVMSPSAYMSMAPLPASMAAPSVMTIWPPLSPAPVSAVTVTVPLCASTSPAASNRTSCSAVI